MDLRKLKTLIELFENSDINELEITEGEDKVRLSRAYAPAPPPRNASPSAEPAAAAESGAAAEAADGTVVHAPMVGTFYRSSAPDKPPFVKAGQRVEAGQTLCIIEAMKLMNQIEAPRAGVIARILVENGEPVGYNDPLFVLE